MSFAFLTRRHPGVSGHGRAPLGGWRRAPLAACLLDVLGPCHPWRVSRHSAAYSVAVEQRLRSAIGPCLCPRCAQPGLPQISPNHVSPSLLSEACTLILGDLICCTLGANWTCRAGRFTLTRFPRPALSATMARTCTRLGLVLLPAPAPRRLATVALVERAILGETEPVEAPVMPLVLPRWASVCSVLGPLFFEAASALLARSTSAFETIAGIAHVAFCVLLEVSFSRTPAASPTRFVFRCRLGARGLGQGTCPPRSVSLAHRDQRSTARCFICARCRHLRLPTL